MTSRRLKKLKAQRALARDAARRLRGDPTPDTLSGEALDRMGANAGIKRRVNEEDFELRHRIQMAMTNQTFKSAFGKFSE